MNCSELDQMLCPYLDGEFGPDESLDLEGHLATCPACARKVHQESAFRSAFRARAREAAAVPLPEGLSERVQAQIQTEDRRARVRAVMPYAAAALLAAGAGGGYVAMRPSAKQDRVTFIRTPRLSKAHVENVQLLDEKDRKVAYITYESEAHAPGRAPRHFGVSVFRDEHGELRAEPLPHMKVMRAPGGFNVAIWRKDEIVYQLVADLTEADIRRMVLSDEHEDAVDLPAPRPTVPYLPAGLRQ